MVLTTWCLFLCKGGTPGCTGRLRVRAPPQPPPEAGRSISLPKCPNTPPPTRQPPSCLRLGGAPMGQPCPPVGALGAGGSCLAVLVAGLGAWCAAGGTEALSERPIEEGLAALWDGWAGQPTDMLLRSLCSTGRQCLGSSWPPVWPPTVLGPMVAPLCRGGGPAARSVWPCQLLPRKCFCLVFHHCFRKKNHVARCPSWWCWESVV